jgi:hypothetical protein
MRLKQIDRGNLYGRVEEFVQVENRLLILQDFRLHVGKPVLRASRGLTEKRRRRRS